MKNKKTWFSKEGKKYIFDSKKFSSLNSFFGVDDNIKKIVDESLKKQELYLKSNFANIANEKFVSFFDMSYSANLKPTQYYGEMFNKVNSLQQYANDLKYDTPIFITITPPSYLKPLKQIRLGNNKIKMVDNPRFSGQADYVNLAREFLSNSWRKFARQRLFRDMKDKYGHSCIYMRTYEPMIDGTPHLHLVAFIPKEYKERFVKLATNYFSKLSRFDIKTDFNDGIGGVVAYILKYILKSFANSKNNKLDDVGYWYAYHRIRRFTMSRTLIPMKLYRLINGNKDYQNLLNTTKLYQDNQMEISLSINPIIYETTDYNDVKNKDYKVQEITVFVPNDVDSAFKVIYQKSENISVYEVTEDKTKIPLEIRRLEAVKPIPIKIGKTYYITVNDKLVKLTPTIVKMSDLRLWEYYKSLNVDDEELDLKHFGVVQNECVTRGLISGKLENLNDFNLEIGA